MNSTKDSDGVKTPPESSLIYGMRKYKKKIEEDEELAKSIQNGMKFKNINKTSKVKRLERKLKKRTKKTFKKI